MQHLNAREFRWWVRDQAHKSRKFFRDVEFPWMVLFCERAREELIKAEDERVFADLDRIAAGR